MNNKYQIPRNINIEKLLSEYNKERGILNRHASFDYCFNYFQKFKTDNVLTEMASGNNLQMSCLQLGFYLASWGMYRGSSFVLQKSFKIYEPVIEYISSDECDVWAIDVNQYTEENILRILSCKKKIIELLKQDNNRIATDTLVSKIMLGVFGNVPAFDSYFCEGSNLRSFSKSSLEEIYLFYKANEIKIKKFKDMKTLSCDSGVTGYRYTIAKIIDMVFFQKGFEIEITRLKQN